MPRQATVPNRQGVADAPYVWPLPARPLCRNQHIPSAPRLLEVLAEFILDFGNQVGREVADRSTARTEGHRRARRLASQDFRHLPTHEDAQDVIVAVVAHHMGGDPELGPRHLTCPSYRTATGSSA